MKANNHYFSYTILTADINDKTVLEQARTDIIIGTYPCTKYSPITDIHGTRTGMIYFFISFDILPLKSLKCILSKMCPA